jgi:hypothetical protein
MSALHLAEPVNFSFVSSKGPALACQLVAVACCGEPEHPAISEPAVTPDREEAMKTIVGSAALALFLVASGSCNAQMVVKQEPFEGKMLPGQVILVDDGTCGKGKIQEVTGGELGAMNPRPRTRRCIPKDKK